MAKNALYFESEFKLLFLHYAARSQKRKEDGKEGKDKKVGLAEPGTDYIGIGKNLVFAQFSQCRNHLTITCAR